MQTHHKKTKKTLVKVLLTAIILSQVISGGMALASIFSSNDTSKTTFTDFKGGLQAPSTTGYAPGLVQATDARQYILNVTNFFLGFLGLIAVAVIIYGGFMYVTDMGKGESQGKGKKAITYAITGLLIVLGSYAIVNTVLQATSPEGPGTGGTGSITATAGFSRMNAQIKLMSQDIANAYNWQYQAAGDLFTARTALTTAFKAVDNYFSNQLKLDPLTSPQAMLAEFQTNLESVLNIMNNISITFPQVQSEIELGDVSMGVQIAAFNVALKNYADKTIDKAKNLFSIAETTAENDYNDCMRDIMGDIRKCVKTPPAYGVGVMAFIDYSSNLKDATKISTVTVDPNAKDLIRLFVSAQKIITEQFQNVVIGVQRKIKEDYLIVTPITTIAETEFMSLISRDMLSATTPIVGNDNQQWIVKDSSSELAKLRKYVTDNIQKTFNKAPLLPSDTSVIGSNYGPAMTALAALYEKLKDLKFVDARITASSAEGNAPMIVNFSSVGSINPNGKTILNDQIYWDLNGDGSSIDDENWNTLISAYDSRFMQCNEKASQTASCIFLAPGTYRVRLKIKAGVDDNDKDPITDKPYTQIIGAGIDTVTIKVNPPENKLNLSIQAGENTTEQQVIKYDDNGFLVENRRSVNVSLSAAKAGITFNASLTKTKDNLPLSTEAAQGATITWNFGDNSFATSATAKSDKQELGDGIVTFPASDANLKQSHNYNAEGSYTITVEVKNKNNVTDRKVFTLNVAELVPLISIPKTSYNVNENIVLDGSDSTSDKGRIKNWIWSDDNFLTKTTKTVPTNAYSYKTPGSKTVSLKVEDDSGESNIKDEITIAVTSAAPVAAFSYRFVSPRNPGVIELDASKSYDPDSVEKDYKYQWSLNGDNLDPAAPPPAVRKIETSSLGKKISITFMQSGTYTIGLVVTDNKDPDNSGDKLEKDITIASVLDVDIADIPTAALAANKVDPLRVSAEMTIPVISVNAKTYRVDFGDGQKEEDNWNPKPNSNTMDITHTYDTAGTYLVTAFVFDNDNNENSVTRQVYVTSATAPTAIISMKVNNENKYPDAVPAGGEIISTLSINRNDTISFDANESKNVDNTGRRLQYNWTLMTGATKLDQSPQKQYTRTFDEKGEYEVSLVVTNADNLSQSSSASKVKVKVEPSPVTISGLTAVPVGSDLTTPVDVKVTAIGAEKPDGQIVSYKWWYFDVLKNRPEGVQITQSPTATITVGTLGASKTESTYAFALEMTDNENNRTTVKGGCPVTDEEKKKGFICIDKLPSVTVTNGPNDLPVAKFNVDRTTINVGESVQFISSSEDPDGNIKNYTWDFEGNGFFDNSPIAADAGDAGAIQNKQFDKVAPDGIPVSLKVEDDKGGIAYSTPVVIYVEGQVPPPVAAFTSAQQGTTNTVRFTDKSTTSDLNKDPIISRVWDFDTSEDSSGDGIKDNDNDVPNTTTTEPSYTYSEPGIYRAKLTVTDQQGQINSVSNFVKVTAPLKPAAPQIPLDARLLTTPSANMSDGRIHLQGDSANVTLDYSTSTGNITKYVIDKNINFDTNGNGNPYDDEDKVDTKPGSWTTGFSRSFGNITVRLTVIDSNGSSKSVDKSIVFDPKPAGGANIFASGEFDSTALLVSIVGFAILASVIFKVLPKGAKED